MKYTLLTKLQLQTYQTIATSTSCDGTGKILLKGRENVIHKMMDSDRMS